MTSCVAIGLLKVWYILFLLVKMYVKTWHTLLLLTHFVSIGQNVCQDLTHFISVGQNLHNLVNQRTLGVLTDTLINKLTLRVSKFAIVLEWPILIIWKCWSLDPKQVPPVTRFLDFIMPRYYTLQEQTFNIVLNGGSSCHSISSWSPRIRKHFRDWWWYLFSEIKKI